MGRSVWLVRHGNRLDFVQPEWFNRAVYRYDPPLCPQGQQQAQELGDRLQGETIDHLFVSPFLRTVQTAYYCAERLKLMLKIEAGLGEWLNPDWLTSTPQLSPLAQKYRDFPLIDRHYSSLIVPQYPENFAQMQRRSQWMMDQLITQFSGNLLIVGHKHPLQAALAYLLQTEISGELDVCAVNQLQQQGDRWQWVIQNDSQFLTSPGIKVADY